MRILILLFFVIAFNLNAQSQTDTLLVQFKTNHLFVIKNDSNNKLLVFLHGGVNNPYFKQDLTKISLNYLLENNTSFIRQAIENGFNIIIPITDDSLNWLERPQMVFTFLKDYIQSSSVKYQEIYMSGFSDGGTGSYKIFYSNPTYFNGLIVFNGFPQHSNAHKKVAYATITDKKIFFCSTYKDNTIPYEFLLTEYCKQKTTNSNTYFYLTNGGHSFHNYKEQDLQEVFNILIGKNSNKETVPIQGYLINDKTITLYPFRKKIVRRYNFGKDTYLNNRIQFRNQKEIRN